MTNSLKQAPYVQTYHYDRNDNLVRDGWQLQHYAERFGRNPVEWRPNEPFEATLILEGQCRGRSAAYFLWLDEKTGTHYPMFMSGVVDLMKTTIALYGGVYHGVWIVVKRGQNYGIELYHE